MHATTLKPIPFVEKRITKARPNAKKSGTIISGVNSRIGKVALADAHAATTNTVRIQSERVPIREQNEEHSTWRIISIDYGPRKAGFTIGNQASQFAPIEIDFVYNNNLFPVTKPTVESLSKFYNMPLIYESAEEANSSHQRRKTYAQMFEEDERMRIAFELRSGIFEKLYPLMRALIMKRANWRKKLLERFAKEQAVETNNGGDPLMQISLAESQMPKKFEIATLIKDKLPEYVDCEEVYWMAQRIESWSTEHFLHINVQRKLAILGGFFGLDAQSIHLDDKENFADIPTSPEGGMHGYFEILSVYLEFWQRSIGKIDAVVIESQPMELTPSGVIGQCMMGMFFRCHFKDVSFINANHKLHIFPLDDDNVHNLIDEGLWKQTKWSLLGPSGRLAVKQTSIVMSKIVKSIPSFCYHLKDKAEHSLLTTEQMAAYKAALEDLSDATIRVENGDDGVIGETHTNAPIVINIDGDDEVENALAQMVDKVECEKEEIANKSNPKSNPKKRKRNTNIAIDEDLDQTAAAAPSPKKKKKGKFGRINPFAHAKVSKEAARSRIENKIEAVRRVKLIFSRRGNCDVIGEKWKRMYDVMWNDDMRRDAADSLLQMFAHMSIHWKNQKSLNTC